MYRIHCRRANIDHIVGTERVVSAHRTSDGIVAYVRCPCGDIVVVGPDAEVRTGAAA